MKVVELSRCVVPILSMRLQNVPQSLISVLLAPAQGRALTRLLSVLSVLQPRDGKDSKREGEELHVGKTSGFQESGQ